MSDRGRFSVKHAGGAGGVAADPPTLIAVVDTEEEFDWNAPFDRAATSVSAMRHLGRAQRIFDEFGIRPVYAIDYPVVSHRTGYEPVLSFVESARAVVGAHLHPWVSPPHEEKVTAHNSFAGNLPADLERRKIARLADEIELVFGTRPKSYKAGRYGFGPNTARTLQDEGFEVDLSPCPPFDFSAEGGPDYSHAPLSPSWIGEGRRLLQIPCTGAYIGLLSRWGPRLRELGEAPSLRWARLAGVLSRAGCLDRLHLSPEGYSLAEMTALTRALLRQGLRIFTLSFHSPSLEPGHTTYVRSRAELEEFLSTLRGYLDFFFGRLQGVSCSPLELKRRLEGEAAA